MDGNGIIAIEPGLPLFVGVRVSYREAPVLLARRGAEVTRRTADKRRACVARAEIPLQRAPDGGCQQSLALAHLQFWICRQLEHTYHTVLRNHLWH